MCGLALRCSSVAISCEFVSLALQCDTARRATRDISQSGDADPPGKRQPAPAGGLDASATSSCRRGAPTLRCRYRPQDMALAVFRPLLARLTQPRASPFACDSVILNASSNGDGFRHVELTHDTVRLEFDSPRHSIYQRCLEHAHHPMVKRVENKMSFGAGATVVLDRTRFTRRLLQKDETTALPALADDRDIFDVGGGE